MREYGLAKLAASYDARRNKQYWQMLKRLHGGTEEAVEAIKKNGDDGIWHGTRKELLPQIEKEGLKPGRFREFGTGTFFGDKQTAGYYNEDKVVSATGTTIGSLNTGRGHLNDTQEMVDWVRKNPSDQYRVSEGETIRLAKPSELAGTKILYPNATDVKVFDVTNDKTLAHVGSSQSIYLGEHDKGIKRVINQELSAFDRLPKEQQIQKLEEWAAKRFNNDEFYEHLPPDEKMKKLQKHLEDTRLTAEEETGVGMAMLKSKYRYQRQEELAKQLYTPRNEDELNSLAYYGKLRGKRVFDRLNAEHRAEMFVDRQGVGPELIRHADGRPLQGSITKVEVGTPVEESTKVNPALLFGIPTGLGLAGLGAYKWKNRKEKEVNDQ